MKCPKCDNNHRIKREGPRCSNCGYGFVFNPARGSYDGLTDGKMKAAIAAASAHGTHRFTRNQLYAAVTKRIPEQTLSTGAVLFVSIILGVCIGGFIGSCLGAGRTSIIGGAFIGIVIGLVKLVARARRQPGPALTYDAFQEHLATWLAANPEPLLLQSSGFAATPPGESWPERDLYDYGVERILVVDSRIVLDMLVSNGFHAQERTLVLSTNGYPDYLLPVARQALASNPALPVFLLEAASPGGLRLPSLLAQGHPVDASGHPVIPIGLTTEDAHNIGALRHILPRGDMTTRVPLDYLSYPVLCHMLQQCFAHQAPVAQLLAMDAAAGSDGVTILAADVADFG